MTDLCFVWRNSLRQLLQEVLQHNILVGINYCNAMIGNVLSWKPRIFRLLLQFSLGAVWECVAVM